MAVKTNDLKKGTRIQLRNGWYATIADNAKGNIRMADVEGDFREIGSVYSHDILRAYLQARRDGAHMDALYAWIEVEHTPAQIKLRKTVASF
jgi:hypothetical protein